MADETLVPGSTKISLTQVSTTLEVDVINANLDPIRINSALVDAPATGDDGKILQYELASNTLKYVVNNASNSTITKTTSVVFTAETVKQWSVDIVGKTNQIYRGRLWIDADPGVDFDDNLILNIYSNSDYRAENKLRSYDIPVIYRELSIATTGLDTVFNIGGSNTFQVEDLIKFLGVSIEAHRISTLGSPNPNNTVDNVSTVYPINTAVVLVTEHESSVYTVDAGNLLYFELVAPAPITLSLTSEIVIKA